MPAMCRRGRARTVKVGRARVTTFLRGRSLSSPECEMDLTSIAFRLCPKQTVAEIPIAVFFWSSRVERSMIWGKLDTALSLIRKYAPIRLAQVQRDIASILVIGDHSIGGSYDVETRMCELPFFHVLSEEMTPERLAFTLVHEAQHGRLYRLGFGYQEGNRERIERICTKAARAFARRIPGGSDLVINATTHLSDPESSFSNGARWEARAEALDQFELPAFLKPLMLAYCRRQVRKAREAERGGMR
jgi:hypothetical protein